MFPWFWKRVVVIDYNFHEVEWHLGMSTAGGRPLGLKAPWAKRTCKRFRRILPPGTESPYVPGSFVMFSYHFFHVVVFMGFGSRSLMSKWILRGRIWYILSRQRGLVKQFGFVILKLNPKISEGGKR